MYSYPYAGSYSAPGGYVTQQQPIYSSNYAPQQNQGYVSNAPYQQHNAPSLLRSTMASPTPQPSRVIYDCEIELD